MNKLAAVSIMVFVAGLGIGGRVVSTTSGQAAGTPAPVTTFGAFSVSLTVKNLQASREFYEKLDFKAVGGDPTQNWLILRNGVVTIGLFQGVFERNTLTFNPGWDQNAQAVASFTDVREHQRRLKSKGLTLAREADEKTTGPAGFMLVDPDGNPILMNQHAPASLPPYKGR